MTPVRGQEGCKVTPPFSLHLSGHSVQRMPATDLVSHRLSFPGCFEACLSPMQTLGFPQLTFFHADFGKEFPSQMIGGEVHPESAPLQALCCALCSTEHRARFEGEKRAKRCPEKERKRGGQQRRQKEKRTRENTSAN